MDMGLTTPCHIDDLLTSPWLTPTRERPESRLHALHRRRHMIDTFPGLLSCDLHSPFYVYTNSQLVNSGPHLHNNLLLCLSDGHTFWRGDILIVKGSHEDRDIVADILQEDISLIKLLVLWYVTPPRPSPIP
jgi:hypothetical protein